MSDTVRVKLLTGRKKYSVKVYPIEHATQAAEAGKVKILDDVPDREVKTQTTTLDASKIHTPEDPTCKGETADGSSCKRSTDDGDDYCWQHEQGGE